jgi:hypothetical protein
MQATKQRISTHKRTRNEGRVPSDTVKYVPRSKEGMGMYVFVCTQEGRKVSFTRHCSEAEAERVLSTLN